jgi:hypothetical protein
MARSLQSRYLVASAGKSMWLVGTVGINEDYRGSVPVYATHLARDPQPKNSICHSKQPHMKKNTW